jgi:arginase family enzyme
MMSTLQSNLSTNDSNEDWRILILNHDKSSEELGNYIKSLWPDITDAVKIKNDLSTREEIRKAIKGCINNHNGKLLTLYGTGKLHHYTYGLCTEVADKRSNEYSYFHFDAHNDSEDIPSEVLNPRTLNYGNFVPRIMKDSKAKSVRYVGSVICHILPFISQTTKNVRCISNVENVDALKKILENLPNDLYMSTDLDVLAGHYAVDSDFQGAGRISVDTLIDCYEVLKKYKNIISADILGYSRSGQNWRDSMTLEAYAKIAKVIIPGLQR